MRHHYCCEYVCEFRRAPQVLQATIQKRKNGSGDNIRLISFEKRALMLVPLLMALVLVWMVDNRTAIILNLAAIILVGIIFQVYLYLKINSTGRLHERFFAHVFLYIQGIDSDILKMELDGKLLHRFKGNAENSFFTLPPGNHRVKLCCRNASIERYLDIQEGMTIRIFAAETSISLVTEPPKSAVQISASEAKQLRLRMIALYLLINFFFILFILRILRIGGVL